MGFKGTKAEMLGMLKNIHEKLENSDKLDYDDYEEIGELIKAIKENTINERDESLQNKSYMRFIKPLVWDENTKIKHVYKVVSVAFVPLPVQGNWESHIAIYDENEWGFTASLWLMNGAIGINGDCFCRTIEQAKANAESWWVNFVSHFLSYQ